MGASGSPEGVSRASQGSGRPARASVGLVALSAQLLAALSIWCPEGHQAPPLCKMGPALAGDLNKDVSPYLAQVTPSTGPPAMCHLRGNSVHPVVGKPRYSWVLGLTVGPSDLPEAMRGWKIPVRNLVSARRRAREARAEPRGA